MFVFSHKIVLVFVVFMTIGFSEQASCPSPELILPCSCSGKHFIQFDCKDKSIDIIKDVFEYDHGLSIFRIDVHSTKTTSIPANIFGTNNSVQIINFYTPKLISVDEDAFKGQKLITGLFFAKSSLYAVPSASLKHLTGIKEFGVVSTSSLTKLHDSMFRHLEKPLLVSKLDFGKNEITTIEKGAFQHVTKLKYLYLDHNKLQVIPQSSFPAFDQYLTLHLEHNYLTSIPVELFSVLPSSSSLRLGNNNIEQLDEKQILHIYRKKIYIDLTGDRLDCNCDMAILSKYYSLGLPKYLSGTCFKPYKFESRELKSFTEKEFNDCNSFKHKK